SLKGKRILILSPHPDDAEIAAYGLYASYPENTYVVTVTAGDAGEFKYDEIYQDSLTHYLQKGKIRTWNSLTVPMLGGVKSENIINLGYFNEALPTMY
ncbi:PIG-L family deacetylase, partial [Halomonas marinisediminis]